MMTESPLCVTASGLDPTGVFVHSIALVDCIPAGNVIVMVQVRLKVLKPSASKMFTGLGTDSIALTSRTNAA